MSSFFTRRIDWREDPKLWAPLAWGAAVLWPGAVFALFALPPTRPEGRVVLVAVLAACLGIAGILKALEWERAKDGAPRTRLGVIGRFLFLGFVFTVLTTVAAVVAQGLAALFGRHELSQNLAETTSALSLGFGELVFTAVIGVSWSLWAGIAVSLIAFTPRQESVRLRGINLQSLSDPDPGARPQFGRAQRPETDVEAALRPDWD